MAIVKTDFYTQDLNQFAPKRLRGELMDWGLNAEVMEVQVDVSETGTVYAGDKVMIVGTSSGKLKVALAGDGDAGYGYAIYNPKKGSWKAGDKLSILRDGGVLNCVTEDAISAGAVVYYDPTDGSVTTTETDAVIGIALAAVSATTGGILIPVEIVKESIVPTI